MIRLVPEVATLVELLAARGALKFGDFTLKSGRKSPYFINMGALAAGADVAVLGAAYAATVRVHFPTCRVVFGPAYKGIPLALATAQALDTAVDPSSPSIGWAFDRKEAKTHGDGGMFVGMPLTGQPVVMVDDVLTAGTAMREAMAKLALTNCSILGAVVAVDRQERGADGQTALQALANDGLTAVAVVTVSAAADHLLALGRLSPADRERIAAHLAKPV